MCSTGIVNRSSAESKTNDQTTPQTTSILEQSHESEVEQVTEQIPTQAVVADQTYTQEPEERLNTAVGAELIPATESAHPPQSLTNYYFQVDTSAGVSTMEISASTPEDAQRILREFRGNPTVIQGPVTSVAW